MSSVDNFYRPAFAALGFELKLLDRGFIADAGYARIECHHAPSTSDWEKALGMARSAPVDFAA